MLRLAALIFVTLTMLTPTIAVAEEPSPCIVPEGVDISMPPDLEVASERAWLGQPLLDWVFIGTDFESDDGTTFSPEWDGCGALTSISSAYADEENYIVGIELWADRNDDIEAGTLLDPDQANWTIDEATYLARRLMPVDAIIDEPVDGEGEWLTIPAMSDYLATTLTSDAYEYVGADGEPGDFQVILSLSSDGSVFAIEISLGDATNDD